MNLKKRLNRIKASRGFTLVEVLVATLITFILVGSVMSLFTSVSSLVTSVNTSVFTQGLLENYAEYIRNTIDSSRCVVITDAANLESKRSLILNTLGKTEQIFNILYINSNYELFDCTNPFTLDATNATSALTAFPIDTNDRVFNKEYYLEQIVPQKISTFTDDKGTEDTSDDVEYKDAIQLIFHPKDKVITRKTTFRLPNLYSDDCLFINVDLTSDTFSPIYILYIPVT